MTNLTISPVIMEQLPSEPLQNFSRIFEQNLSLSETCVRAFVFILFNDRKDVLLFIQTPIFRRLRITQILLKEPIENVIRVQFSISRKLPRIFIIHGEHF